MTHLTPAEIVALRDGEADALPEGCADHLEGCEPCRQALEGARFRARRVEAALPVAPALTEERLRKARESVRTRVAPRPRLGVAGGFWSLSRAAGLLLLLAGGAAALPGSPVREWVRSALEDPPVATQTPAEESAEALVGPTPETGIRLRVEGGPVGVSVEGVVAGTRIEVTRSDGPELAVFAPEGSRFRSAEGQVDVSAENGPVRIRLPAGALPATLTVSGRVYLVWTADGPEIRGPVAERDGERIVFEVAG